MGFFRSIKNLIEDRNHNQALYKSGAADRTEIRETTVGWHPDPWHKNDGFTADPGNDCIVGTDPVTGYPIYDTPSGNVEYYKVVRKGRR